MSVEIATDSVITDDSGRVKPTAAMTGPPVAPARKIAIWFEGEQEFDLLPFHFFVVSANAAQQSFQFYFPDPPDELNYESARHRLDSRDQIFRDHQSPDSHSLAKRPSS